MCWAQAQRTLPLNAPKAPIPRPLHSGMHPQGHSSLEPGQGQALPHGASSFRCSDTLVSAGARAGGGESAFATEWQHRRS